MWIQGAGIRSHGLHIGFRVNRPELLKWLAAIETPASRPSRSETFDIVYSVKFDAARRNCTAYFGAKELFRTPDLGNLLDRIQKHLERTIAEHSATHLFVHAGVVGWRGKTILLPGRSCTGKSTLVRALLRHGATYFSDEFAVIDSRGLIHPFPRSISCARQVADF